MISSFGSILVKTGDEAINFSNCVSCTIFVRVAINASSFLKFQRRFRQKIDACPTLAELAQIMSTSGGQPLKWEDIKFEYIGH
jgi:hypothetical protein